MTGDRDAIPIDAHPDPVAAYAVEDGAAVVRATNDAFDAAFGDVPSDASVGAVFDRFGVVESTGGDDPVAHVVGGDPVGVYLDGFGDGGPFLARIVGTASDAGYVVFAPLDDCLSAAETAGVGQVASAVSHDLRNPLDVAMAHLRAARETGDEAHFDAVADAHDRMQRIIRDVLTLARGDGVVTPAAGTSIADAVEDAWGTVETDSASLAVVDSLPTATADPDRVRRLFENLFRNSVEHGPEDVTVTVGALDRGFYVADDGPGVPPDERAAVFAAGYSTADGGTGLGLAIVERIAEAHGWSISLGASESGGARFEVRF